MQTLALRFLLGHFIWQFLLGAAAFGAEHGSPARPTASASVPRRLAAKEIVNRLCKEEDLEALCNRGPYDLNEIEKRKNDAIKVFFSSRKYNSAELRYRGIVEYAQPYYNKIDWDQLKRQLIVRLKDVGLSPKELQHMQRRIRNTEFVQPKNILLDPKRPDLREAFAAICESKGESLQAIYSPSTLANDDQGVLLVCPGLLWMARNGFKNNQEAGNSLLEMVVFHELGHSIDGDTPQTGSLFKKYDACIDKKLGRWPLAFPWEQRASQFREMQADFWSQAMLWKHLDTLPMITREKTLVANLVFWCANWNQEDDHPSGRTRVILWMSNPYIRRSVGCQERVGSSKTPPTFGCLLDGVHHFKLNYWGPSRRMGIRT